MTKALTKHEQFTAKQMATMDASERLWNMAQRVSGTALVPDAYRNKPEDAFVAMLYGWDLGLSPMQALQGIAVINGRPTIWGDHLLAVCRSHPDFAGIEESIEGAGDQRAAICTVHRRGQPSVTRRFSVEDAKRAGLWGKKGPWQQYPDRMLQMRPRSFACRDQFADALKGVITREEAEDHFPTEPSVVDGVPASAKPATRTEQVSQLLAEPEPVAENPQPEGMTQEEREAVWAIRGKKDMDARGKLPLEQFVAEVGDASINGERAVVQYSKVNGKYVSDEEFMAAHEAYVEAWKKGKANDTRRAQDDGPPPMEMSDDDAARLFDGE